MRKLKTVLFAAMFGAVVFAAVGCEKKVGVKDFKLEKVSAFEINRVNLSFARGQFGDCGYEAIEGVMWPEFKSDKPVYGSVRFAQDFYDKNTGIEYYFAVDESGGGGSGYDRFYFDIGRDNDLSNDEAMAKLEDVPAGAEMTYPKIKEQVCFGYLDVGFDCGSEGEIKLEIMPQLWIYDSGVPRVSFVAMEARKGRIKVGKRKFDVYMGHQYLIGGRFDRPGTALHLIPKDDKGRGGFEWWGAEYLMALHKIDGRYYRFSSTPSGDRLIVRPYNGEFGVFRVGRGGRNIKWPKFQGSLYGSDKAVALGGELRDGWPKEAARCKIPVGDYSPFLMHIKFGGLRVEVSNNYHSDGKPRNREGPRVFGIKIRNDRAFVLDFSNEPEVMFALPGKGHRVKVGEVLEVKAVLIDAELDIMIRDLRVASKVGRGRPLDPEVFIRRSNGEVVGDGLMPFG